MAGLRFAFLFGVSLVHLLEMSTGSAVTDPTKDAQASTNLPTNPSTTTQVMNGSDALLTTPSPPASNQKLFLLRFNWNNGTQWQEELADTESDAFIQTANELKQKLDGLFEEIPYVLDWNVIGLANDSAALKVSAHVQTTASLLADELAESFAWSVQTQMKSEKKMVSDIIVEELNSTNAVLSKPTETSLAILPQSTTIHEISPLKTAMSSTQAMSTSTTPQMPTVTSSAALGASAGLPTDHSKITTEPTIPADAVKFLVVMTIKNLNYSSEMAYPNSTVFKNAVAEIQAVLYTDLCVKKLPGCIDITVIKLQKGSVIVTSNIHMSSSTKYKQSDVQEIISDSAKNDELGHLRVSSVVVNKEEKEKEDQELGSSSAGVFIYVLCGAGAMLVIALTILAVSKYQSCKKQTQVGGNPSST
ncbi:hypothetical protein ACROYT_G008043 [Oculina patagonica]